jgi:hypothetical protein
MIHVQIQALGPPHPFSPGKSTRQTHLPLDFGEDDVHGSAVEGSRKEVALPAELGKFGAVQFRVTVAAGSAPKAGKCCKDLMQLLMDCSIALTPNLQFLNDQQADSKRFGCG